MNTNPLAIGEREERYIVVEPDSQTLDTCVVDLEHPPRVSFCIPTMNSERTLDRCLRSIVEQDYPDIEIVIVDGHSHDSTIDIARRYTDLIFYDDGNLGSARQTSIDNSSGEILAIFDSDVVIPHERWLVNSVKYFNYSERVSTVWPANAAPPESPLTTRLYFDLWQTVMEDRIRRQHGLVGGGNALFLRECINRIGGISKELHWGEDFDWARKLKQYDYVVVFVRDCLYHDTMHSFREFARKQLVAAETFTVTGFGLMDLTIWDVFYEQVVLGTRGMITGLSREREAPWLLFPIFLLTRAIAYGYTYLHRKDARKGYKVPGLEKEI